MLLLFQIAGEIKDFDPGEFVDKKSARRLDLVIKYLLVAGKKASSTLSSVMRSTFFCSKIAF